VGKGKCCMGTLATGLAKEAKNQIFFKGWGATSQGGSTSQALQATNLIITAQDDPTCTPVITPKLS